MQNGKISEIGQQSQIFDHPQSPYTQKLLSSVLSI